MYVVAALLFGLYLFYMFVFRLVATTVMADTVEATEDTVLVDTEVMVVMEAMEGMVLDTAMDTVPDMEAMEVTTEVMVDTAMATETMEATARATEDMVDTDIDNLLIDFL